MKCLNLDKFEENNLSMFQFSNINKYINDFFFYLDLNIFKIYYFFKIL